MKHVTSPGYVQEAVCSYTRSSRNLSAYQREPQLVYPKKVSSVNDRTAIHKLVLSLELSLLSRTLARIETNIKEYMKASSHY